MKISTPAPEKNQVTQTKFFLMEPSQSESSNIPAERNSISETLYWQETPKKKYNAKILHI